MATYTVRTRGGEQTFESDLTNAQALAALAGVPSSFARERAARAADMLERRGGVSFTAAQWAWVHRLVWEHRRDQERAIPRPAPVVVNMDGIRRLFTAARSRIRHPKVRFTRDGLVVVLSVAGGRSQKPGW